MAEPVDYESREWHDMELLELRKWVTHTHTTTSSFDYTFIVTTPQVHTLSQPDAAAGTAQKHVRCFTLEAAADHASLAQVLSPLSVARWRRPPAPTAAAAAPAGSCCRWLPVKYLRTPLPDARHDMLGALLDVLALQVYVDRAVCAHPPRARSPKDQSGAKGVRVVPGAVDTPRVGQSVISTGFGGGVVATGTHAAAAS